MKLTEREKRDLRICSIGGTIAMIAFILGIATYGVINSTLPLGLRLLSLFPIFLYIMLVLLMLVIMLDTIDKGNK